MSWAASRTDGEPEPLPGASSRRSPLVDWSLTTRWTRKVAAPACDFLSVLNRRRSSIGGPPSEAAIASVMRHATMLRERSADGRFGTWESRSAPSAGGLHGIRIVVLPMAIVSSAGLYDPEEHGLLTKLPLADALDANKTNVASLTGASCGTTLQLVADCVPYEACYSEPQSLIWRDAGALASLITFVATAMDLQSVILGRHGDEIVRLCGLDDPWRAVGAVHVSGGPHSSDPR